MLKNKKNLSGLLFLTVLFILFLGVSLKEAKATSQMPPGVFSEYAWSENIGWIDMGGVRFNADDLANNQNIYLSGYAWSPNVGWISFAEETDCPSDLCKPKISIGQEAVLSGWARVLSLKTLSNGQNNDREFDVDNDPAEWADGWIKLSGSIAGGGNYGARCAVGVSSSGSTTKDCSGYAWGSKVIGWINFSRVKITYPDAKVLLQESGGGSLSPRDITLNANGDPFIAHFTWFGGYKNLRMSSWNPDSTPPFVNWCNLYKNANNTSYQVVSSAWGVDSNGFYFGSYNPPDRATRADSLYVGTYEYYVKCATFGEDSEGNPNTVESNPIVLNVNQAPPEDPPGDPEQSANPKIPGYKEN